MATAFNQMSHDLAHANQLRRQMTADVAHDLRTPLTVLAGYIESMQDGVLAPTPARLEMMYREVEHLQRLVTDLRTLSQADAGELTLHKEWLEPAGLIERLGCARHVRSPSVTVVSSRGEASSSSPGTARGTGRPVRKNGAQ